MLNINLIQSTDNGQSSSYPTFWFPCSSLGIHRHQSCTINKITERLDAKFYLLANISLKLRYAFPRRSVGTRINVQLWVTSKYQPLASKASQQLVHQILSLVWRFSTWSKEALQGSLQLGPQMRISQCQSFCQLFVGTGAAVAAFGVFVIPDGIAVGHHFGSHFSGVAWMYAVVSG